MRVTESTTYRNFLSDIETLNESLNKTSRQVSSGKKITQLSDSPAGSAALASLTELASKIDQYKSNIHDGSYFLGVTDSILNEVNNLVTSIYTKGSQAASEAVSSDSRAVLAEDIRSLRDQIFSLANTQIRGRYLFAGSRIASAAFTIQGDSVTYRGDDDVNSVSVGDGIEVQQNFSGSVVFDSIFSTIGTLLAGIDGNNLASTKTALGQFSSALSSLGQVRGKVGTGLSALENIGSDLDSRAINLVEQRGQIEDADIAEAALKMKQTQTALDASLTAGGSVLSQRNLFDILG